MQLAPQLAVRLQQRWQLARRQSPARQPFAAEAAEVTSQVLQMTKHGSGQCISLCDARVRK